MSDAAEPTPAQAPSERDLLAIVREWAVATMGVMVLLGGFAAWVLAASKAQAAEVAQVARVDAGAAAARVEGVARELDRHERESAAVHLEMKADLHELQADIRELYRVVRDGRRSERLEQPLAADGGR